MKLFSSKLLLQARSFLTSSKKMATRTVLILGSGPRIGDALSEKFAAEGYKVALVSRKGTDSINEKGYLSLQADFANTDPSLLSSIFEKVKSEFNAAPSVVVYNAGSITPPPDENSVLSIPSVIYCYLQKHC
jgi:NAD(P)-dependent dehydrogenase (short-subunit alcohol dehydrogenase family)